MIDFDLTAATTSPYLPAMHKLAPTSQLLLGFDFPCMPAVTIQPSLRALLSHGDFSAEDREDIFDSNALSLYPRLRQNRNARVA